MIETLEEIASETEKELELYARVRKVYGDEHQMRKAAEEMCELATAIMRYTNGCDGHSEQECLDNILEEIVDVRIMLAQLCVIFEDSSDSLGRTMLDIDKNKHHRLAKRIEKLEAERGSQE